MTRIMNNKKKQCILTWFIENYSYCSRKNGEALNSPDFSADIFEGTVWNLALYPRGNKEEAKGYISLFLERSLADGGPENFPLEFELSVLAADESALFSKKLEYTFTKGIGNGFHRLLQIDEVLLERKTEFLPQDVLCVRCKIHRGEGKLQQVTQISAKTRIGIAKMSFLRIIEDFSTFEPNEIEKVKFFSYPINGKCIISNSVYFADDLCGDSANMMVEITPRDKNVVLSKCKAYLLDASGTGIKCGSADNRSDTVRKDIRNIHLSLTRQVILNKKSEFLIDGKLSLLFDCIFSSGTDYNIIEKFCYWIPITALNQLNDNNDQNDAYNTTKKLSACPNALEDLKSIYNDQVFADVELKTKTKSFPAHKIVLCARSLFFKTIMTNDKRKKNIRCIPIHDTEDDILQQLLLFMYSDKLEDRHWDSAIKLLHAAHKYEVEKLKVMCSSFLLSNISTSTASDLLLLADTHGDSDLTNAVEDFILKNEEQVVSTREWENFTESNSQLVCKTMLLKYKRKTLPSQQKFWINDL